MSTNIQNTITGGTVSIEDGIKAKEEFAPARKAKVELQFSVPEGMDGAAFLEGVTKIADAKLQEILGKAPKTDTTVKAPAAEESAAPKKETKAQEKARLAAEAEANKPAGEKTKADLAKEAGLPVTDKVEKPAAPKVVDEDDLSDVLGEAAPVAKVISDKELGEIAGRVNAKKKAELGDKWAPSKIREVVAQFTGKKISDVPKITEVPAEKRAEFVAALEAL